MKDKAIKNVIVSVAVIILRFFYSLVFAGCSKRTQRQGARRIDERRRTRRGALMRGD
jgi:hypothetical protein